MFQLSNPIMQTGKNSSVKVRQHKKTWKIIQGNYGINTQE